MVIKNDRVEIPLYDYRSYCEVLSQMHQNSFIRSALKMFCYDSFVYRSSL